MVCDSHENCSFMFFFLHAEVWSPKKTGLERPLNPCSQGLAQLTVKGQALTCLQVSTRNTVFPPSSLCFRLHSCLRIAGVSCSSLLTSRASVNLHIWDCCCVLQDICPSSTRASITPECQLSVPVLCLHVVGKGQDLPCICASLVPTTGLASH